MWPETIHKLKSDFLPTRKRSCVSKLNAMHLLRTR